MFFMTRLRQLFTAPPSPTILALRVCTLLALVGLARNVALLLGDDPSWYLWATLPLSVFACVYAVRCTWHVTVQGKGKW